MDFVKGEIVVPVTVGTLEAEPGSNTFDEHTETTVAFDETSEFEQGSKQKCEDECESQMKYHYGWNKELSHAWRKPLDDMKASPELAISADELPGNTLGDKGAVLCKWADGQEYVLGCVCGRPASDDEGARRKAKEAVRWRVLQQAIRGDNEHHHGQTPFGSRVFGQCV